MLRVDARFQGSFVLAPILQTALAVGVPLRGARSREHETVRSVSSAGMVAAP